MKKHVFGLMALAVAFLFAPAHKAAMAQETPSSVVVSIAPQKYMVERIAGNLVTVTVLVKAGADPHAYEPSPAQMRECAAARLYFSIGVPFEDIWLPRISGTNKELQIVSTIRDIHRTGFSGELTEEHDGLTANHEAEGHAHDDTDHDHGAHAGPHDAGHEHEEHHHGAEDPHVWLSPLLVKQMLPSIVETLSEALPEHAAVFQANAEALAGELQSLHEELGALFAATPEAQRVFLTFHPSWGYLAREFGLTELSIEMEGKEPGPRTMKNVIDAARKYKLHTIFVEPQFPTAAATAVAANIRAEVKRIDPLAENLPENLRQVAGALSESFPK